MILWVAVCCSVLQFAAACCKCIAVCGSVLQCAAVCCSVLQCAAVCCSVLQCVDSFCGMHPQTHIKRVLNESRNIYKSVRHIHQYSPICVCVFTVTHSVDCIPRTQLE